MDVEMEQQALVFGDAAVSLYMIRGDHACADRELLHRHSFFEIHLLLHGMHDYQIDGKALPVRAGEMVIIPPETVHKAVLPQNGTVLCVLPLSVRKRSEGEPVYSHLLRCLKQNACAAVRLDSGLIDQIAAYNRRPRQDGVRALLHRNLAACEIIVGIMDAIDCGSEEFGAARRVDFDVMLETLVENSHVPLSEIARRLGYSQRQTARKIKAHYGKTFSQVRREMR